MSDFKIQRGVTASASNATSVTITAGVDYTAPAALANAFIIITSIGLTGMASAQGDPRYNAVNISNPANLLTSITFDRTLSNSDVFTVAWEIIEYVGAAGGANEFIVRKQETLTYVSGNTTVSGAAVATVANNAKVCVFVTGQRSGTNGGFDDTEWQNTAAWNTVTTKCDFTRTTTHTTCLAKLSYALVEFTGSNWTVQRVAHSYTTAGATETETITAVTLASAFIHAQFNPGTWTKDFDSGHEVWLSSTTAVSFRINTSASVTNKLSVCWVVSNSTMGGANGCQRFSGSYNENGAPTTGVTITAVTDTAQTSVTGLTGSDGLNTTNTQTRVYANLSSTTNVNLKTANSQSNTVAYRFEVFEWPTAAAGAGFPVGGLEASVTAAESFSGTAQL